MTLAPVQLDAYVGLIGQIIPVQLILYHDSAMHEFFLTV